VSLVAVAQHRFRDDCDASAVCRQSTKINRRCHCLPPASQPSAPNALPIDHDLPTGAGRATARGRAWRDDLAAARSMGCECSSHNDQRIIE
jgi:hypothetical protein